MDQLTLVIISAVANGCFAAIGLYIGFTKGTGKTVDIAIDKLQKRFEKSPTMQRFLKLMEMSDKILGDDQAIEQITGFFKEARELVSSSEAKNFFKNVAELMKELGAKESEVEVKLPTLSKSKEGGD